MNAFFYKRREEKKEGESSVCSRQKNHCRLKLYIHIRNSKPVASASRILVTVNKITLPTILCLCPQKKRKGFNPTFLHGSYSSWWIPVFFAGSSNISDKGAVVSRQFCGPLGNTFPRWSRAGGRACRQRFALSILLACSHHPPNLSGVPEGMLRPFLDVLTHPLQPGMQSMYVYFCLKKPTMLPLSKLRSYSVGYFILKDCSAQPVTMQSSLVGRGI